MVEEIYREIILDLYQHPKHKRQMENPSHAGKALNASCGDSGVLYLHIQDSTIVDASWEGDGCAISTAAMEVFVELLFNKSLNEVKKISMSDLLNIFEMQSISPGREKCLSLPLKAIASIKKMDK